MHIKLYAARLCSDEIPPARKIIQSIAGVYRYTHNIHEAHGASHIIIHRSEYKPPDVKRARRRRRRRRRLRKMTAIC